MTTRNFVPRNNNEGQLGTENKKWNKIYTNEIFATNFTGNLTGTADKAIKDNKNQQIDSTYIKNISINNDTLTVTKGNNGSQNIVVNNISHAISSDNAINANKLQELTAGNSKGQIPINNGIENVNLNAALLNGKASSYFATSNHTHTTATQSSNGYMSNADKKKLDGIASGAEVNQNAFANVKVGSNTIQADAKQDTLELAAGANISLVGDTNNDKITIGVTGKVASASQADSATEAGNINKGFQVNEENFHSSDFRQTILGRANSGICARPFCGKLPNNTAVSSPGMAFGGIDTHGFIQLEYGTPNAYVGGGNANKINWYKKLAFADGTGASGTWGINISGTAAKATKSTSAATSTKALQDTKGQQIDTTYIKSITANNATLTITKGNGSTSTTTINNVSNATNANNLVISGTSAHIKYGGGDVDENTAISQNKVNLLIGSWYSTGFRDLCSTGNPIRVAINHRNGNIKTTGNVIADGAMYTVTPATTDNSTRVATTAYVKNNISEYVKNNISETLKKVYPVGSIYMSTVSTNPATLFGFGTWEAMPAGRVLLAQGTASWGTYNAGSTGGEATHQLTVGELPVHTHSAWTDAQGNHNHSITSRMGRGNNKIAAKDSGDPMAGTDYTSYNGNHSHNIGIGNTGSSQAHNNMMPYLAIYIWKRVS